MSDWMEFKPLKGKLTIEPCEICGAEGTENFDYDVATDKWVCKKCGTPHLPGENHFSDIPVFQFDYSFGRKVLNLGIV